MRTGPATPTHDSPDDTARLAWWSVAAAMVVATAARFLALGRTQFWNDEYATYMFATQPLSRLLGPDIHDETNPPYYYPLQKAWLVFGDSRQAMRSLPAILGVLAVPLTFVLGRRLAAGLGGARFADRVGIAAAWLVATSPLHIQFSRDIRCYPLLVVSALAALVCVAYLVPMFEVGRGPSPGRDANACDRTSGEPTSAGRGRLWLGYVLATTSAVYAHNTAVLLPTLMSVLVGWWWICGVIGRPFVLRWTIANLAVLGLFAPWLEVLLSQVRYTLADFGGWIPRPSLGSLKSGILGAYPYERWAKPLMCALGLVGAWSLRKSPRALLFAMVIVVGEPLLLYLLSFYRPMFIVRSLVWPTAVSFILAAAAISLLRHHAAFALGIVIVSAIGLFSARGVYRTQREESDVSGFIEALRQADPARDAIVFAPVPTEWEYRYEARLADARLQGLGLFFADQPPQLQRWFDTKFVTRASLAQEARRFDRVWLLRELRSLVPVRPGDGFEDVPATLAAIAARTTRWDSGRYELVRYDIRK